MTGYLGRMMKTLRTMAALALASFAWGCATEGRISGAWQEIVETVKGQPGSALKASEWAVPERQAGRFSIVEGKGSSLERSVEDLDKGRWRVVHSRDGEPWVEETFSRSGSGDTLLEESINHEERVITRFDPPLLVAPSSLSAGSGADWKGTMRIHPIDRPDELRDEGDARQEVRLSGKGRVRTGGGWAETVLVETVLKASLKAAKVETTTSVWVGGKEGVVAERVRERATFLGLSVRDVVRAVVRR